MNKLLICILLLFSYLSPITEWGQVDELFFEQFLKYQKKNTNFTFDGVYYYIDYQNNDGDYSEGAKSPFVSSKNITSQNNYTEDDQEIPIYSKIDIFLKYQEKDFFFYSNPFYHLSIYSIWQPPKVYDYYLS